MTVRGERSKELSPGNAGRSGWTGVRGWENVKAAAKFGVEK